MPIVILGVIVLMMTFALYVARIVELTRSYMRHGQSLGDALGHAFRTYHNR